ncbi:hypothetical protein C5E07_06955 [Pseudoclavibacter sp. RFBJ3]|uniref:hypothetical protein n=1 Tax=unclassified Pseudoclavibacter TaxID=2615177 RepID=UPI000CE8EEC5|nr:MULTISPECIES: hypothetical protein [unclassified Pseudoclavibacter]PPF85378.1 hypothetical protein C5C12_03820 [Pseudoclavibacter sp. RFBJ5]PPF93228.1 hypothetical protein C5E07_06955 [Pseudoclavibacter sp. RFBJ3]PPF98874.1 hypothetical protein C5C19_06235 [Pseudoclavibacter sp. RFBH5]PPG24994.1 hypothetical protein C5E13_05605 [Pseudoclavibacter sp. RFBI4]
MELFWGIALIVVGGTAAVVDNWRHAVVNPEHRIPWIGRPPVLPRAWYVARVIMGFATVYGVLTVMRATELLMFMAAVLAAVAVLPGFFVAVAHNRRVNRQRLETAPQ